MSGSAMPSKGLRVVLYDLIRCHFVRSSEITGCVCENDGALTTGLIWFVATPVSSCRDEGDQQIEGTRESVGFALLRDLDSALGMRSSHSCALNALDSGRAEARTLPIPGLNHCISVMVVD